MFIKKKVFDHIKHTATVTYKSFSDELEEVKHERDLARACAEGYKKALAGAGKEIEYYKNMYERERRKNEDHKKDDDFERLNYSRIRVLPRIFGIRLQ
jgi:ribosome modulation factor